MKYTISLDTNEIKDLVKTLNQLAKDLPSRCQMAVQVLADAGIKVASANMGEYKGMVLFTKEVDVNETGCTCLMVATDTEHPVRTWVYKGEEKSAEVSPILMAEFGSGWHSEVLFDIDGVGQGTFPGQTHAFDPKGWFWKDKEGKTHHSYGEAPTYPMYKASLEMVSKIQEVFETYL